MFDAQRGNLFEHVRMLFTQRSKFVGPGLKRSFLFSKLPPQFGRFIRGCFELFVKLLVVGDRRFPGFVAAAIQFGKLLFVFDSQMLAFVPQRIPFGVERFPLLGELGLLSLPLVLQLAGNPPPLIVGFAASGAGGHARVLRRV
jgi:hypothetical protein